MKALFRSSQNKSQASLPSNPSRSSTPEPGTAAYPTHGHAPPGPAHSQGFPDRYAHPQTIQAQSQQPPIDAFYQQNPPIHTHPVHGLSRESTEAPYEGRRPSQPTILVPPHPPPANAPQPTLQQRGPAPIPGQTQFGQSKQVHVPPDKEHKRSKRSIFSLTSSKDKDKDKENSPTERKLGRSGSINILKKHNNHLSPTQESPQSPQSSPHPQNPRGSAYFGRPNPSQEDIPEDPSHYEQYRQQQQIQAQQQRQLLSQQQQKQQQQQQQQYQEPPPPPPAHQAQYESVHSQATRHSPDYEEDIPCYSPKRDQYQAYQQPEESRNSSENYLPYRGGEHQRPSHIVIDQHNNLRPPSPSSQGPPSPLNQPTAPGDSRPSTAATNRYSAQSVGQQGQLQQMAGGQSQNGGRQMRDPREDEHRQYQQDPRARMSQQVSEQGRNTPPPRNRDDRGELDYGSLLQKHEELQAKYSKVKRYYFEREAQVTQLQNTVANQRLSMSKTSLDDAQYTARFERLSGAINNLAFNIRKEWKDVPPWLRSVCNRDAHTTGTKEMTAVGRACITRWLADTVFDRVFHPALPRDTSMLLKHVEKTLRRQGQPGMILTDEQRDDLTVKITTWRLTTIEGLADQLNSRFAPQIQEDLTKNLTDELTNSLKANLNEPGPLGLQEGVSTIVQQAVSISANIPLESRDICIEYFMPGELINETYMKVETGMTQLITPGQDERLTNALKLQQHQLQDTDELDEGERDVEAEIREATGKAVQGTSGGGGPARTESLQSLQSGTSSQVGQKTLQKSQQQQEKKGSSFLGGFVSKKPPPQSQQQSRQGSTDVRSQATGQSQGPGQGVETKELSPDEQLEHMRMLGIVPLVPGDGKVRFAAFFAVEVRGKMLGSGAAEKEGGSAAGGVGRGERVNVLMKAPVYEL